MLIQCLIWKNCTLLLGLPFHAMRFMQSKITFLKEIFSYWSLVIGNLGYEILKEGVMFPHTDALSTTLFLFFVLFSPNNYQTIPNQKWNLSLSQDSPFSSSTTKFLTSLKTLNHYSQLSCQLNITLVKHRHFYPRDVLVFDTLTLMGDTNTSLDTSWTPLKCC